MITVSVLFFASLRDATGADRVTLNLPGDSNQAVLMQSLRRELGSEAAAALEAENVRVAVNQTLITGTCNLQDGDEVAFLPPVTGG